MSTAEKYRQVALDCLKLAEAIPNPKAGASMLNVIDYWVRRADEYRGSGPEHQRSRARRRHAPVRRDVAEANRTDQG